MTQARRVGRSPSLGELPEILTVEEAAWYLRISRATAYEMARRWRATNGEVGLPVIVIGRTLRVPRAALEHLVAESVESTAGIAEITYLDSVREPRSRR